MTRYSAPLLLCALLLAIGQSRGATIVPPKNLAELARRSRAVALCEAEGSTGFSRGPLVFTETRFRVIESLSPLLGPGELLNVEVPGGAAEDRTWIVAGSPQFTAGGTYLLFLSNRPEGQWIPAMLSYGLLEEKEGSGGAPLLAPLPEADHGALPRPDGDPVEEIVTYERDLLLDHLRQVILEDAAWDSSLARASAELVPQEGEGAVVPGVCSFFVDGGRRLRWQTFDRGGTATMFADASGDPSVQGGPFPIVQAAMDLWMQIPRTSFNLRFGGTREVRLNCAGGESTEDNTIVLGDPCSDIDDLQGCSGVLAFGGPLAGSATHSFDGTSWLTVQGWIMVVNNGSGCLGAANYRLMMAHEMGHGLGYGHVNDGNALMFASCCNAVNATDTLCAQYSYPAVDPQNVRPTVDAGGDITLAIGGSSVRLKGTAADDGLPAVPGRLTTEWKQLGGPGAAVFADASLLETTVSFPASGSYLLSLTASDGQLIRSDVIEATVEIFSGTRSTLTFEQGSAFYSGTVDTAITQSAPAAGNARATELSADGDDPAGSNQKSQAILLFSGIFGPGTNQIPPGSKILAALLELTTTNNGDGASVHRMVGEWADTDTWNAFGGDGIQAGDEAVTAADATAPGSGAVSSINVTPSLAAWSEKPCENFGWAFLPRGSDGWDFFSAEGTSPPRLTVELSRSSASPIIADGDAWMYWKGTANPPAGWNLAGFEPGEGWIEGRTGIGYGDGDDATELTDMQNGYLSVFARKTVEIPAALAGRELLVTVIHDDGAVAYWNGTEVGRANMPAGAAVAATKASGSIEARAASFTIRADLVSAGESVLAVSAHNVDVGSSDFSFTAILVPLTQASGVVRCDSGFQRGDVTGEGALTLTDAVSLLNHLFLGGAAPACPDAADADDSGSLAITDAIGILNHLFLGAGPLPAPGSDCGPDPTEDALGECAPGACGA